MSFPWNLRAAASAAVLLTCLQSQAGEPENGAPLRIVPKTVLSELKERVSERAPEPMPFYVYNNAIFPPVKNFAVSGYMGDVADLKLAGAYKNLHQEGYPCLKVMYTAEGSMGWAGVAWQNPANNWGEFDGGYNLKRAKELSFWVKGDKGGEIVEFKLGGDGCESSGLREFDVRPDHADQRLDAIHSRPERCGSFLRQRRVWFHRQAGRQSEGVSLLSG